MNDVNMAAFTAPKTDQANYDDFIGGPRTIVITGVRANAGSPEQPVSISFEGDAGKPYKPCKSMRRVMVNVWGADASKYIGRSMTLYGDPSVQWGGMAVGGIRISHMSHIDKPQTMALTASKTKRAPFTVQPLVAQTFVADAVLLMFEAVHNAESFQSAEDKRGEVWKFADKDQKAALKAASDAAKARITTNTTQPEATL
jgi:hypothetical protein